MEVMLSAEQWNAEAPECPRCSVAPMAQEFYPPAIGGSHAARAHAVAEKIAAEDYGVANIQSGSRTGPRVRYQDQGGEAASTWMAGGAQLQQALALGRQNRLQHGSGLDVLQANLKSGVQPDLIELSKRRSMKVWGIAWLLVLAAPSAVAQTTAPLLPVVPTNAALTAFTPIPPPLQTIRRAGFYAAGDGGSAVYTYSATACSLNGGNGDNGWQVRAATGGCWLANLTGPANVKMWGARCDGTADDKVPLQSAISAVQTMAGQGGSDTGIVELPAGSCAFTAPLAITATVELTGQGGALTELKKIGGGGANLLNIGYQSAAVSSVRIANVKLSDTLNVGGYAISVVNAGLTLVENIVLDNTFCGVEDRKTNWQTYRNIWGYTKGNNCQAFYWHAVSGSEASDQLILNNIGINMQYYGNDGFVWEGMAQTLNAQNIIFIQANHGFWVRTSPIVGLNYPAYGAIYNMQIEGAQTAACEFDTGQMIYITDSFCVSKYGQAGTGGTQGNGDAAGLEIFADGGRTSDLKFENMQIGLSANYTVLMHAHHVDFNNVTLLPSSLATPGGAPAIQVNSGVGSSTDYGFSNVAFCATVPGVYTPQNNYGLVLASGVGSVHVANGNFRGCLTGEVYETTATALTISSSTDRSGLPLPDSHGAFVSNQAASATNCGTGPQVSGNNLMGVVHTGTGSFTNCTINFAGSHGIGSITGLWLQGTGVPGGPPGLVYPYNSSQLSFTFARSDGASLADQTVYWRASQGTN